MYTFGAGRILIKSIIIVCLFNLMTWKASWAHRTGENEEKKDNDKIKQVGPNVERLWLNLYQLVHESKRLEISHLSSS